jgi:hypothetical protein
MHITIEIIERQKPDLGKWHFLKLYSFGYGQGTLPSFVHYVLPKIKPFVPSRSAA